MSFVYHLAIGWKHYRGTEKGNTVSELTINIGFVLTGLNSVQRMLRSQIIINLKIQGIKMIRIPTHRAPTHPGEMLLEEFLKPMALTQRELAAAIHVPYQRVNEIINGRRGVTPSTALRLAKLFGVSADFWMNLQLRWDLYFAQQSESDDLKGIKPFSLQLNLRNKISAQQGAGEGRS